MRKIPILGMAAATILALASCTGGGGGAATPTGTATTSPTATAKVYTEDELRSLISGMADAEGSELKLYSKEQVDQGGRIADLLMNTARVDPEACKSIATAGLLNSVDNGEVAVALSDSAKPRTLSAQSGREGPDAVALLKDVRGKMAQCSRFTVDVVGQRHEVGSKELESKTKAEETFATVSTRGGGTANMLMQVSGAEGRLLVVATKGGSDLIIDDQRELEDLVNEVLEKAAGGATGTATSSPTGTSTRTGTATSTSTATPTANETGATTSPTSTTTPSP